MIAGVLVFTPAACRIRKARGRYPPESQRQSADYQSVGCLAGSGANQVRLCGQNVLIYCRNPLQTRKTRVRMNDWQASKSLNKLMKINCWHKTSHEKSESVLS